MGTPSRQAFDWRDCLVGDEFMINDTSYPA